MPENGEAFFEGSQARVFLRADGTVMRRLKRRTGSTAMKAAAQLLHMSQHPNMVRIFAIENGDICMEAMHISLQKHLPAGQTYAFHTKLHIALAIAHGMHHLHTHSIDHGDLCPSNVLIAWKHGEMIVKLCDFYNEHTGTSRTAAYAAPEVVRSPPSTMCAADLWAFACCLLFLEGVEPFHGVEEDQAKLFYLALHDCVAFREAGVFKQFRLQDCAYAPARHIGETVWADILASAFVPDSARLTSHQLLDKLAALQAPPLTAKQTQINRAPLKRMNV
jgi:serine/threonine protein kinase